MSWILEYWWILLGALAGVGIWIGIRRKRGKDPDEFAQKEIEVADATAKAQKLEAELGAEKATAKIKEEYKEQREKLDEKETEQVELLAEDPVALARYLERISR